MRIRPCPFCGGEGVLDGSSYYWVRCKKCKVETRGVATKAGAVEVWNKRVGDDLMERMEDDGK